MSVSDKFQSFCAAIRIPTGDVDKISYRYKRITKQLNSDFWDTDSETAHSLYVGSYGRDTEIHISDIDMIIQLPWSVHEKYDKYLGNGQSALLQEVKDSIGKTYTSYTTADGQVVNIDFTDGISFEVVPGFLYTDGSYSHPDTNSGGSWKTTNPKPEIQAIRDANEEWNYNLKRLCRMARVWKGYWSVPIGGLLIDTFAYNFLRNWQYKDKSYFYYDFMVRDFFKYVKDQDPDKNYWLAPGSGQYVWRKGNFEHKALRCFNISLEAVSAESDGYEYTANQKWKEIFGSKFTG